MAIPKPFSRVILMNGTPIVLPADLPREEMAAWADFLTIEMDRLEGVALRIATGETAAIAEIDRSRDSTYRPQTAPDHSNSKAA